MQIISVLSTGKHKLFFLFTTILLIQPENKL